MKITIENINYELKKFNFYIKQKTINIQIRNIEKNRPFFYIKEVNRNLHFTVLLSYGH